MSEEKDFKDPELKRFFEENKEMIEKLLSEEKEFISEFHSSKREKVRSHAKDILESFNDPKVQRHMRRCGAEFLMGMAALLNAMPICGCNGNSTGDEDDEEKDGRGICSLVKVEVSSGDSDES